MNPFHLFRMRRLVEHPPSKRRVILVFAVVALCAVIWGLEHFGLWPDWATTQRVPRGLGRPLR